MARTVTSTTLALATTALAMTALLAPAADAQSARPPTPRQVQAAVQSVRHSPHLWATINVCDTGTYPQTIGIRGQAPGLGFPARVSMIVQVEYWDSANHQFAAVPGRDARHTVRLGVVSSGFEQGGHSFTFARHAGRLSGAVTFQWRRGGRVLATLSRTTSSRHTDADGADPAKHSAATCTIR